MRRHYQLRTVTWLSLLASLVWFDLQTIQFLFKGKRRGTHPEHICLNFNSSVIIDHQSTSTLKRLLRTMHIELCDAGVGSAIKAHSRRANNTPQIDCSKQTLEFLKVFFPSTVLSFIQELRLVLHFPERKNYQEVLLAQTSWLLAQKLTNHAARQHFLLLIFQPNILKREDFNVSMQCSQNQESHLYLIHSCHFPDPGEDWIELDFFGFHRLMHMRIPKEFPVEHHCKVFGGFLPVQFCFLFPHSFFYGVG